jgi:hypothetical protein
MGYLFCKECDGYYELQDDESPEDYDVCYCGGELEYRLSSNELKRRSFIEDGDFEEKKKSNKGLIIAIIVIGLFLALIFIAIPALLIYRAYFGDSSGLNASTDINHVRPMRMLLPLFGYYW